MQKARFYSIVILTILALIIGGAGYYFVFGSYSEGSRSGRLINVTKRGFIFKTYEGELDMGGISTMRQPAGKTGITSVWNFSVNSNNEELIDQLQRLGGHNVQLRYEERFFRLIWEGETKYFVTGVDIIN
ncbi:MAG: hypothetical protein H3C43_13655 [Leptonema sp. (in: Bacteria)]|nr:hypothetical protein [Leptonema sp. (in: bacteria)]